MAGGRGGPYTMTTMKGRLLPLSLATLLALAVSGSALAQHGGGRGGRGGQQAQKQQQVQRPAMPPSQGARETTYRQPPQPQQQRGRMSDEERQQLRRDISDHGRDIYGDRAGSRR
jgi:hypothetical protein